MGVQVEVGGGQVFDGIGVWECHGVRVGETVDVIVGV
jgi:hypothetical protein